jgi:hypothetical protein
VTTAGALPPGAPASPDPPRSTLTRSCTVTSLGRLAPSGGGGGRAPAARSCTVTSLGRLAQLGRAPPLQGGGRGIETLNAHCRCHSANVVPGQVPCHLSSRPSNRSGWPSRYDACMRWDGARQPRHADHHWRLSRRTTRQLRDLERVLWCLATPGAEWVADQEGTNAVDVTPRVGAGPRGEPDAVGTMTTCPMRSSTG